MGQYLFSMIVPVYNEGSNLYKSIDSFINQPYSDYEIILVNDGSTDDSGMICDRYAEEYECICVIHKENGGGVEARKYGIQSAKGKYIIFADADDYISNDYMKELHNIIEKPADYYMLNNRISLENGKKNIIEKNFIKNGYIEKNLAIEWVIAGKAGALWDKIFIAEILKRTLLTCNMMYGDDVYMNLCYLKNIDSVYVHDSAVYIHIIDSSTGVCINNVSSSRLDEINYLYQEGIKCLNNLSVNRKTKQIFVDVCIRNMVKTIGKLTNEMSVKEIKGYIRGLELMRDISMFKPKTVKSEIYYFLLKHQLFGMMRVVYKIKK